jgi:EmrB/QacA subfamily drug resistance transporter
MTVQTPRSSSRTSAPHLAAAVMIVASLMDMIDGTIVNVALPTIHRSLHATGTELEWTVSAYMLAFAASLIAAGSAGDLFGRKFMFAWGIVVFGAASLCAGLAPNPGFLIGARLVQGTAAAAMAPQVLATFRTIFTGKALGQAFALYGMVLGFASAIGVVLGGVLTQANVFGWGWRTVFFVNVPVALISLIATLLVVPENREREARRPDAIGMVLLAGSLVAIVYPLLEGRQLGWPLWSWGLLAAGLLGLGGLLALEARRGSHGPAPLLRAELFRSLPFSAGLLVQLLFSLGLQGFSLIFALWIQAGQGFTPLHAGLTMIAFSAGAFIGAPFSSPLAQRYGRGILMAGAALLAGGMWAMVLGSGAVGIDANPWPIVPGLVIAGLGLALLVIPLVSVVLVAAPAEAAGAASGIFGTAQQLGGAIGVAIIGTIFFGDTGAATLRDAFNHTAPAAALAFILSGALAAVLPTTAVPEEYIEHIGEEELKAG